MASFITLWSIVFWVNVGISHGLLCYECTSIDPLSGCVTNNGASRICPYEFCTLYRVESNDGNPSFLLIRNCTDTPLRPNITSGTFDDLHVLKYYFRYCNTDLCNSGDATDDDIPVPVFIVQGKENSAKQLSVNILLLIISSLYQIFL